jgi:hypothetical protein
VGVAGGLPCRLRDGLRGGVLLGPGGGVLRGAGGGVPRGAGGGPRVRPGGARVVPGRAGRPVARRGPAGSRRLRVLEPGRQRRRAARQVLVVVDAQQPDPALLAEGQRDEAAELDQLRLGEVPVQPLPQLVAVSSPGDRLGVGQGRLLPLVIGAAGLEVQQAVVGSFGQTGRPRPARPLVAAVLTPQRPGDVHPAEVLDRVIADALVEQGPPGVREGPERVRRVRAHRGGLRPGGSLPGAAFHLRLHPGVHGLQRDVADPGTGHGRLQVELYAVAMVIVGHTTRTWPVPWAGPGSGQPPGAGNGGSRSIPGWPL